MTSKHYIISRFTLRLWTENKMGIKLGQSLGWKGVLNCLRRIFCPVWRSRLVGFYMAWLVLFDADVKENYSEMLEEYGI